VDEDGWEEELVVREGELVRSSRVARMLTLWRETARGDEKMASDPLDRHLRAQSFQTGRTTSSMIVTVSMHPARASWSKSSTIAPSSPPPNTSDVFS